MSSNVDRVGRISDSVSVKNNNCDFGFMQSSITDNWFSACIPIKPKCSCLTEDINCLTQN